MSKGNTVLVISAGPEQFSLAVSRLQFAGCSVIFSDEAEEGLRVAQRTRPGLIISELAMPNIDGLELCRRVRQDETLSSVPIVLVGDLSEGSSIVKDGLRCGATDYVIKRIDQGDLFKRCSSLIGLKGYDAIFDETDDVFRTLIENISDIITILAADGTILFESPSIERSLGYKPEDLTGKNGFGLVHPEDVGMVVEYFKTALHSFSASPPIEYRFRHKDGSWKFLESIGKPYNDPHHGMVAVITSRDSTERKNAIEEKRETDSRLRTIFESAAIGMALVKLSGHCVQTNPALERMLGYSSAELRNMSFVEFTYPGDIDVDVALLKEIIDRKRENYQIEKRYITKKGDVIWTRLTVSTIGNGKKDLSHVIAMVEDINDQKLARAALSESEERFRAQYEGLPIPTFTWKFNGDDFIFQSYNAAAHKLTHGLIATLTGKKASEHFKERPDLIDAFRQCVDEQITISIKGPYRFQATGELKQLDANIVFIKPDLVMLACKDITEQTETERLLKESQERFELISVATNDGLWDRDFRNNTLWLNEEFYNLLGFRSGDGDVDSIKETWYAAIHPEDSDRVRKGVLDAIAAGQKYLVDEYRMTSKDGSELHMLDRSHFIYDAGGKPLRMIGAIMDITELRRTETALIESQEHLALAQRAASIGSYEFDLKNGRGVSSPELDTLYGLAPGALAKGYREWTKYIHPDDLAETVKDADDARKTGEIESEFRIIRPDGDIRWMHSKGKVISDPNGEPLRIVGVNIDITERKLTEQGLNASRIRMQRQNKVLNQLNSQHKLFGESFEDATREIIEISAHTLEVESVSVWMYSEDRSKLRVVDLYEWAANRHITDVEISASDYPIFFRAMQEDAAIVIPDVYSDPRTVELLGTYLLGNGITSALSAPIRLDGKVVGVISHGHVATRREWTLDEQNFAGSMADVLSMLLEANKRRVAEDDLRRHKQLYKSLIDSIEGIVWEALAGTLNYSFISRQAERLLGYPVEMWIDEPDFWAEHLHPDDRDRVTSFCAEATRRRENHEIDYRMIAADGRVVWLHDVVTVDASDKDNVRLRGVMVDITESKQAAASLAEANERAIFEYVRLLERLADLGQQLGSARELKSIFRAISNFAVNSVPCSCLLVFLYDEEAKTRKAVYGWYNGDEVDLSALQAVPVGGGAAGRAIKQGEVIVVDDYLTSTGKSPRIYVGYDEDTRDPRSCVVAPMKVMGRVIGVVEVQSYERAAYTEEHATAMRMAANLTANAIENVRLFEAEQMRAEQLRQSQRLESVGRLAGGIAHDFNNMLTAINGFSDLTLRKMPEGDPLRGNLLEIRKAGTRSAELTQQLLAFSRRQMLHPRVIDLNQTVNDTSVLLERLIGEDVELCLALSPDIGNVQADPGQITQVIMNLAVNSRDAMPKGGKITIETANQDLDQDYLADHADMPAGSYVMLAVSDTGSGMSPEVQKHIFEPFFTTKPMGHGTGLGLATVYGIVKQSGGYIWAYSEVGQGAVIKVYLPRMNAEADKVPAVSTSLEDLHGDETILLVEDEEIVRRLAKKILETCGYTVIEAMDGAEAVEICRQTDRNIDLLLTDVVMPKMSGRQLVQELAGIRPELTVLFMSGYTDDSIVRHGVIESGENFIQKPFTFNALAGKIRVMLDQEETDRSDVAGATK